MRSPFARARRRLINVLRQHSELRIEAQSAVKMGEMHERPKAAESGAVATISISPPHEAGASPRAMCPAISATAAGAGIVPARMPPVPWVEAWLPTMGSTGFDPTNDIMAGERDIRVPVRRDYADVPSPPGTIRSPAAAAISADWSRFDPRAEAL